MLDHNYDFRQDIGRRRLEQFFFSSSIDGLPAIDAVVCFTDSSDIRHGTAMCFHCIESKNLENFGIFKGVPHWIILTLVGAKHKSDFQLNLDIQNLMLVFLSNLQ